MGRDCGYLASMSALAAGANRVLTPESPPDTDEESMCRALTASRAVGRRLNLVIVAEGPQDLHGNPITAEHEMQALEQRLGADTRVTSLGHVQRGGGPAPGMNIPPARVMAQPGVSRHCGERQLPSAPAA
jgi:6-phosphofructokinase 1